MPYPALRPGCGYESERLAAAGYLGNRRPSSFQALLHPRPSSRHAVQPRKSPYFRLVARRIRPRPHGHRSPAERGERLRVGALPVLKRSTRALMNPMPKFKTST